MLHPPRTPRHTGRLSCIIFLALIFAFFCVLNYAGGFWDEINKPDGMLSFGVCSQDVHVNLSNLVMHT
jgi:hypothetical protein